MIPRCADARCVLAYHHHGPHQDAQKPLARHWWNEHNTWSGHHPGGCDDCGQLEDLEVGRLAAGGELRPDQHAPKWLREGKAPPPRPGFRRGAMLTCGSRGVSG